MTDEPDHMTADELQELADGVANQNSTAINISRVFKKTLKRKPDGNPCGCIEFEGGFYFQCCDCGNSGDLANAQSWCEDANLWGPYDHDVYTEINTSHRRHRE